MTESDTSKPRAQPETRPGIPLVWHADDREGLSDENRAVVDEVARLIKADARDPLLQALKDWPARHTVELFVHLPLKRARKLFRWAPGAPQARVIAELNPAYRAALLRDDTVSRLVAVLDQLEPEEAADALEDLPDEVANEVLSRLSAEAEITALRGYRADSAGSIMSRKFVAVPPSWTVAQVTGQLRAAAEQIEKLYAVYVIDADHHPLGYLRLRDLLLSPREAVVAEIMHRDFVAVGPDTDQEVVTRLADRYELSVVPVVDADGRLIGRITPKQLSRVLREEAEEDRNLMAGLPADTRPDEPIAQIVRGRIPWLLVGLFGASLSAAVVGAFEDQLARAAILAMFIPIVMSMAGNAGIQAATVAVQGLASGTLTFADLGWRLTRELGAALINGAIAAMLLIGLILITVQLNPVPAPMTLAAAGASALLSVIVLAVSVGATIPLVLDRLGIDPAMATGVFITTGNDILSVAVFFLIMTTFYL